MKMIIDSGYDLAGNLVDGEGSCIDTQFGVDCGGVGVDDVDMVFSDLLLSKSSNHDKR